MNYCHKERLIHRDLKLEIYYLTYKDDNLLNVSKKIFINKILEYF